MASLVMTTYTSEVLLQSVMTPSLTWRRQLEEAGVGVITDPVITDPVITDPVRWRGATATCSSRCTAAMTGVMLVMTREGKRLAAK